MFKDLVVSDEARDGSLGDLPQVVVSLLHTKTGETHRRLTTTTVFLWQLDVELGDDLSGVALQRAKERAVTVHDDEAELGVVGEKRRERLRVEFVVA